VAQESVGQDDRKDSISRAGYSFVALWAAGLLLLYAIGGYFGGRALQGYRAAQRSTSRILKFQVEDWKRSESERLSANVKNVLQGEKVVSFQTNPRMGHWGLF
jgi:hypothetical protein